MKKQVVLSLFISCLLAHSAMALSEAYKDNVYQTGRLKPIDSVLKVKNGQKAPEFTLPSISGKFLSKNIATRKMLFSPSSLPPGRRFVPTSGRATT